MATTITAGNATNGLAFSADNTGILELKTGTGAGTTAVTISTAQVVNFVNAPTGAGMLTSGTAVTASGTSVNFTGIPSTVKRITVMCKGLSTNGGSIPQIQIGTSGGIQTSGYVGATWTGNTTNTAHASGYLITGNAALNYVVESICVLTLIDSATGSWMCSINGGLSVAAIVAFVGAGSKSLSGVLDRVRITTVNGTDTFDAGTINILWE